MYIYIYIHTYHTRPGAPGSVHCRAGTAGATPHATFGACFGKVSASLSKSEFVRRMAKWPGQPLCSCLQGWLAPAEQGGYFFFSFFFLDRFVIERDPFRGGGSVIFKVQPVELRLGVT